MYANYMYAYIPMTSHNCFRSREQGKQLPPEFWAVGKLSKNFVLIEKFSSKNAEFGAEHPN